MNAVFFQFWALGHIYSLRALYKLLPKRATLIVDDWKRFIEFVINSYPENRQTINIDDETKRQVCYTFEQLCPKNGLHNYYSNRLKRFGPSRLYLLWTAVALLIVHLYRANNGQYYKTTSKISGFV